MKLGKRTLFVPKRKLEEFFGLPEGVEIMGVRPSNHVEQGWEFLLASAGEVSIGDTKVTIFQDEEGGLYRKISLDTIQDAEGDIKRSFMPVGIVDPATYVINVSSEAKEQASKIADEIVKGLKKKGK